MKTSALAALLILLAGMFPAHSQTPGAPNLMPGDGSPPAPDHSPSLSGESSAPVHGALKTSDFVRQAGLDGIAEVRAGQLAQQKSQDPGVKRFAQQMVTDHTNANQDLKLLASSRGLAVPAQLDSEHRHTLESLTGKSGADFDSSYIGDMATAHNRAIALFTKAQHSTDPAIAAFASKMLPTLEMHRQMVIKLQANNTM